MKEYLPVKNILVAIDVCEDISIASPIMEHVLELASAFSSKVWIIHVVPDMRRPVPFNVDSKVLRREVATELCNEHDCLQRVLGELLFMQRPGFEKARCSVISMNSC